jgi:hypothetical protein
MTDIYDALIVAGWDRQEAAIIAGAVTDALGKRPLANPLALTRAACTVIFVFNRTAEDARSIVDGILTAAADCICTFDELSRFVSSVSPITAALGKSIGTVLEGYVGLTGQNVAPALAEQRILTDLRDEWIRSNR